MNTTNVFVELVIIGIGVTIGILFIGFTIFDVNIISPSLKFQKDFPTIIISVIFLSVTYLLGILTDRLADSIFEKKGEALRNGIFTATNRNDVLKAKMKSYKFASDFASIFEYGRSRMRICRGWAINSVILLLSINIYICCNKGVFSSSLEELGVDKTSLSLFISAIIILIGLGCFCFWEKLQKSEYTKLKVVFDTIPDSIFKVIEENEKDDENKEVKESATVPNPVESESSNENKSEPE